MFGIIKLAIDGIIILNDKLNTMEANRKSREYVEGHRDDFRQKPQKTLKERLRESDMECHRMSGYASPARLCTENPFIMLGDHFLTKKEKWAIFKRTNKGSWDNYIKEGIFLKEGYIELYDTYDEADIRYGELCRAGEKVSLHNYYVLMDNSDPWGDREYTYIQRKNGTFIKLKRDDNSIDYEVIINEENGSIRCREI